MSTDVVKTESGSAIRAFATDLNTITEAMAVNIGSGGLTTFDFPRIKVPGGGATQWLVPTLEGDKAEATIEGVIVLARDTRAYWVKSPEEGGGNNPPDCSSNEAIIGIGTPGGNCMACPLAQFGSAVKGSGQACKQVKQLFFLRGDNLLPEVVGLPPTSLKAAKQYLLKLTSQGVPYYAAVTRIALERMQNPAGQKYATAAFSYVRRLTADEIAKAQEFHQMLRPLVQQMGADTEAAHEE